MVEIPTYCEGCGTTFSARYDPMRQCLTVYCEHCERGEITIATRDLLALPESQQRALEKLVERTAAGKTYAFPVGMVEDMLTTKTVGDPLDWMVSKDIAAPTVQPLPLETQASDTLTAEVLDMELLLESMKAFNALIADMLRPFIQAFGGASPEPDAAALKPFKFLPRTPSGKMIVQFTPITSQPLAGPLMQPPVNASVGKLFETDPEKIKREIELLRQCQVKKL